MWVADKAVKGLYQRVRATKTSWTVKARIRGGKTITYTIGDVSKISPAQARKEAKVVIAKTATGVNPMEERKQEREIAHAREFTFGEAVVKYVELSRWAAKTRKDSLETLIRRFGDWYTKPLASITRSDCLARFQKIKKDVAKRQADIDKRLIAAGKPRVNPANEYGVAEAQKAFRIVNAIFSSFANDEVGGKRLLPNGNPAEVLTDKRQKHVLRRRENYLGIEQRESLYEELTHVGHPEYKKVNQDDADLVWLLLHTGCRFTEIKNLQWANVDLKKETLTAVDTKNKTDHTLPLTAPIKKVLERRFLARKSDYVFPSPRDVNKPMTARETFAKLSDAIGFKFTAHDLRRTLATVAFEQGTDLEAIGRVLNHKKRDVTGGYAQTTLVPLRATLERVALAFFEDAGFDEVVSEEAE